VGRLVRTNVVVDEDLVSKVMELYGLRSKREAIDFSLRHMAGVEDRRKRTLELEGIWADMSDEEVREIYGDEVPDKWT